MHQFYFFKAFYPIFFVFILLIKICVWGSDAYGTFVGSMFLINEICQFGGELYNQEIAETDQQCLLDERTEHPTLQTLVFDRTKNMCMSDLFCFCFNKAVEAKIFQTSLDSSVKSALTTLISDNFRFIRVHTCVFEITQLCTLLTRSIIRGLSQG